MPKNLGTVCHASRLQPRARAISSHVWISDELLSQTFNNFVHRHCRYGSNVPGPLEARRRAAKRRITNTNRNRFGAQLDVPNYHATDPIGLLRQAGPNWWRDCDNVTDLSSRSAWKWNPLNWWQGKAKKAPRTETREKETARTREANFVFEQRLQSLASYSETMKLLDELSMSVVARPQLAKTVLDCALRRGWKKEEIAKFLVEPQFNPPGTSNHEYVLRYWRSHPRSIDFLVEADVLVEATRLGLVSTSGIRTFLSLPISPAGAYPSIEEDWARFCNSILDAAEQSQVLGLRDLGNEFLRSWVGGIREKDFTADVPQLLWRIHWNLLNQSAVNCLQLTLRMSIGMTTLSTIDLLPHLVSFLRTLPTDLTITTILEEISSKMSYVDEEVVSIKEGYAERALRDHLIQLLSGRGPEHRQTLRDGTGRQSFPLTDGRRESIQYQPEVSLDAVLGLWGRKSQVLYLWYAVLASLGAPNNDCPFVIPRKAFLEWIGGGTSNEDARWRCIGAMWVTTALSHHSDNSLAQVRRADFEKSILDAFFAPSQGRQGDAVANILHDLDRLNLPAKNKLLRRLQTFSNGLISIKAPHETLSACLHDLELGGMSSISDDELYRVASIHFPLALTQRTEDLNLDLPRFEALCVHLITERHGMNNIVLRLLSHNTALKLAVNYTKIKAAANEMGEPVFFSSPDEGPIKAPSPHPERGFTRVHIADQPTGAVEFTYTQLVSMLDEIAWAFATTTTMSTRNAFRYTYWMYRFVVTRFGMITRSMRRALWHAAAVRPETPTFQTVQFVYEMILKHEGKKVADALLKQTQAEANVRARAREGMTDDTGEGDTTTEGSGEEGEESSWRPF